MRDIWDKSTIRQCYACSSLDENSSCSETSSGELIRCQQIYPDMFWYAIMFAILLCLSCYFVLLCYPVMLLCFAMLLCLLCYYVCHVITLLSHFHLYQSTNKVPAWRQGLLHQPRWGGVRNYVWQQFFLKFHPKEEISERKYFSATSGGLAAFERGCTEVSDESKYTCQNVDQGGHQLILMYCHGSYSNCHHK